ncbi:MAG: hypothetical protein CO143_00085 [Candidatus Moranbacteria bacterium CG_4_9_14_3_um_filter_45_14]|nr:MAG: hypothetical protein CO143_00085 [Candidatus Moranbacteria bacterium CG_4_9_14_3_um_filter_45_14]
MQFRNISQENETVYTLKENERCVFFLFNRSGRITFELSGINAEARIFAFFIGRDTEKHSLQIIQNHRAPKTISHILIKSVVSDEAVCIYDGTIFIHKDAQGSNASQESRAILLSSNALVSMKPTLEILASDVICNHKATTSPLNQEALFFAETRGLSLAQAETLLLSGFWNDAVEKMADLGVKIKETENIRKIVKNDN